MAVLARTRSNLTDGADRLASQQQSLRELPVSSGCEEYSLLEVAT
jgi:hypothetical protein